MKKFELTTEQVHEIANGKSIKDVLPEAFLEVGKWYKFKYHDKTSVACVIKNNTAYGFGYLGMWAEDISILNTETTPATPEEVKTMLIAEAKKRGYIGGVKVVNLTYGLNVTLMNGGFVFDFEDNYLCFGGATIFDNGKWAEIVPETKEDILTELIGYAKKTQDDYLLTKLQKLC